MPWTRREVRFLLSSGSPLTSGQRSKMVGELHENPALGHERKGFHKPTTLRSMRGAPTKRRK